MQYYLFVPCLFICIPKHVLVNLSFLQLQNKHSYAHVICVKRAWVWNGLTDYFLALIGACKTIRRGKSDKTEGELENAIWGESQVGLLNEWIHMQIHANLCTQGSGSAWGCFDWQLQVCVCWGRMLGFGCICKVGHGCLSMYYMHWIHQLHTASPPDYSSTKQTRLPSKKILYTHQELSFASPNSSMAGSSQGIIIKSMSQLHLAWLSVCVFVCVWVVWGIIWGLFGLIVGGVCEWQNSRSTKCNTLHTF